MKFADSTREKINLYFLSKSTKNYIVFEHILLCFVLKSFIF